MRLVSICLALAFAFLASGADGPRVDINNAAKEVIVTLPGVGPKLADQIIAGRPYKTIDELDRVKGIGPKKLAQIRPHVFIMPMRAQAPIGRLAVPNQTAQAGVEIARININTASQQELEKLPGVGPKRALAIIAARPFQKPEDITKVQGLGKASYEKLKNQITVR
jgi:competence protein ComEA